MSLYTVLIKSLAVGLVLVVAGTSARSEEKPVPKSEAFLDEPTKEVREDFLVPTSPAFIALGVSPE